MNLADYRLSWAAARVNADMTQEEAAKAIHVTKKTLIAWEKGGNISFAKAKELSDLYKCPIDLISMPN